MTSRNPMPPANKAQIHKMLRKLVALDLSNAEIARRLQPLWPDVDQYQVNGLAIAMGLKKSGLEKPPPSLRRFSWEDAA